MADHLSHVSATACRRRGYPGVSAANMPSGRQIADPATRDPSERVRRAVLLACGGVASSLCIQTAPEVLDPRICIASSAAGLRIYAAGGRSAVFVALRHSLRAAGDSASVIRAVAPGATGGLES